MAKVEKQFDTGLRILEILKILLNKDLSKLDLISELSENEEVGQVYTLEAFIKYFNTIDFCGLKIDRTKNIYKLRNALKYLALTEEEKSLLIKILSKKELLYNDGLEKVIESFSYKLLKYLNDDIKEDTLKEIFNVTQISTNSLEKQNLLFTLNKFVNDKLMIKIEYKSKTNPQNELTIELKKVEERNGNIILCCYLPSKKRNKKINFSTITKISQLPNRILESKQLDTIVFEVYGRLSYLYKLKESEKVINFSNNHLVISNAEEDKDILLKRLLKYGENCKIIKPIDVREEFISLTNEILKNLED